MPTASRSRDTADLLFGGFFLIIMKLTTSLVVPDAIAKWLSTLQTIAAWPIGTTNAYNHQPHYIRRTSQAFCCFFLLCLLLEMNIFSHEALHSDRPSV
jgi:hypothetical protein